MSRLLKEPETNTYAGRFAARLRELRIAADLKPADVAAEIGVSPTTVYNWETGISAPSVEILERLAPLYGLQSPRLLLPGK
jgi:transcriptional regulator with XRE-family HTH domain